MANYAKRKNGDFLGKSTGKHPVFSADSLSNTIDNTLEPLSFPWGQGGGNIERSVTRAKGSRGPEGGPSQAGSGVGWSGGRPRGEEVLGGLGGRGGR